MDNLGLFGQFATKVNNIFDLPLPARLYIDSVYNKNKEPINENYFSSDELNTIKDLVAASVIKDDKLKETPGYVNYNTYKKGNDPTSFSGTESDPTVAPNLLSALFTDSGKIKTSLGQFNYEVTKEGDILVKDKYDFNAYNAKGKKTIGTKYQEMGALDKIASNIFSLGYMGLRAAGQEAIPEGAGREINLRIPKESFSKEQYEALVQALNKKKPKKQTEKYEDIFSNPLMQDTTK